MTIYLNEPKNGEKIKTYGIQIRHDGRFYYAAVFPCVLENDGNPCGLCFLGYFKVKSWKIY